ncbi:phosphoenolpyruvate--protein phosphotransferase [Desulfatitalea tepidiphila]|uniref:phosphoenolpyruvate--protein phosphotransferase n=1 Tax=Desulfatitalea tepidiphila TaxID=1185843 RepID=UPI0006B44369|nr:phosphoenolpyruvate--protein phosphotransferase [Desulfatitalea tepidiphila]
MPEKEPQEIMLRGIGGSPGICIGKAYLVDKEGVDVMPKYSVSGKQLEAEKKRFKAAVKKAVDELHHIINDTPEELRENAKILETHAVLLKDKMLYGRTIETIEQEQINAEWALRKVVMSIKPLFEGMGDAYLRDRAEDVANVSDRIFKHLTGAGCVDIGSINKRVILVARDLSPAETSQIQLERVMGFVTDSGGRASHTSIIARSLEIPAVLGLDRATSIIQNDDIIVVDGTSGTVVVNPSEETLAEAETRKSQFEARRALYARSGHLPAKTKDGLEMAVMGNIELPEEVVAVRDRGGDGIGLYRTEFQYLARSSFPTEDELFENYKDVVEVIPDKPVTIRTLDINGDKAVAYTAEQEENPVLGLRAIRYCLKKPNVFLTQLRAILRAAHYGQVRILLPLISQIEEIIETKKLLAQAARSLKKDGLPHQDRIPVGVMIEVPSAAIMADAIAKEVDFFSIGTNDLIQYTMAIDRGNRNVAYLYNPITPAVLRLIKHITEAAQHNHIPVFMCGEMAGESIYAPILVGMGVNELSTNPQAIPVVKNAIRMLNVEQARKFVDELLKLTTTDQIERLMDSTYGSLLNNGNHMKWER